MYYKFGLELTSRAPNRKRLIKKTSAELLVVLALGSMGLAGCAGGSGGGSGGAGASSASTNAGTSSSGGANVASTNPPVVVTKVEFAQTHVIPPSGISWPTTIGSVPLILAGQRSTLALIQFGQTDIKNPVLEVWSNQALVKSIPLNPPTQLPATEGGDAAYGANIWSATIPANLVTPGMSVNVSSDNYSRATATAVSVGANTELNMQILPFVLFGATNANTGLDLNSERVMKMTDQQKQQISAGWPGSITVVNHPLGQFVSPFFVMPPQSGNPGIPAYVATSKSDIKDTGRMVSAVNDITYAIHQSSGDMSLNRVTYASIIAVDNTSSAVNKLSWIGNGVSIVGSGSSTGGDTYGFLLHESGHAMSLHHSRTEYNDTTGHHFPYIQGSLFGSAWGYNSSVSVQRYHL